MAKKQTETDDTPLIFDLDLSDTTLSGIITRRVSEATGHWEKEYGLNKVRARNKELYLSKDVEKALRDERYEDIFSDNRHFVAVRTILPFITSNMTKPEIIPADDDSLSLKFAQDFSKILVEVAEQDYGKDKVRLALQDLLKGYRVGILKIVYDPQVNKIRIEHIDPESVVIGKRGRLRDEPDFVQHTQERTIGQLVSQFPDKKKEIYQYYEISKGVPSQLERVVKITETAIFVDTDNGQKLAIVWKAGDNLLLGKMNDPNWLDSGRNIVDEHMVQYVFFNFLNDGSGYIDETSFIEMAQHTQKQYDKRGNTIALNANYAGIGVPVFGKGAVKEETAAKIKFNPTQRILLDIEDVGKGFTTWTGGQLQPFVAEDKQELKQSVADAWGTNSIQQGQNSDNKTLGQDIMLRNQAEGRQQELIDSLSNSMLRFYQLLAQMIYRYWDSEQYYNFIGEDGEFEHLVISQSRIAKNLGIKIKIAAGSNLPVDRSQKIAVAMKLLEFKRIGTLRLYKELGIEDPEEAYKEYLQEMLQPQAELADATEDIFDREADEDLQMVIGGKQPKEREDITEKYISHLNDYLLKQQYEQLPEAAQKRVSKFVAEVVAQAERKLLKLSMQQQVGQPAMPMQPQDGTMPPDQAQGDPGVVVPPAAEPAALPVQ